MSAESSTIKNLLLISYALTLTRLLCVPSLQDEPDDSLYTAVGNQEFGPWPRYARRFSSLDTGNNSVPMI